MTPIVFLLDVDNTLLDNDRVTADLRRYLTDAGGKEATARYFDLFDELRAELGYADYLGALQRYRVEHPRDLHLLAMSSFLLNYPFAERLYPKALEVLEYLAGIGPTVILSDGDVVFQPLKIERSGLGAAVGKRILVYIHKERELDDVERRFPARALRARRRQGPDPQRREAGLGKAPDHRLPATGTLCVRCERLDLCAAGRHGRAHRRVTRPRPCGAARAPRVSAGPQRSDAPLEKGLRVGALGFVSSVVIGVASTAPGYSVAASLGVVAASVATQSPAVLWLAFLPMLCIASSYYALNRVNPDCGTTFTWVTRSMGPWMGWIAGWALLVADLLVMASLAQIAGRYSFRLFGLDEVARSTFWVTTVGVIWIVAMTWICYVGIDVSAKTQWYLLAAEVIVLALFAAVALVRVYAGHFANSVEPTLHWLNPFDLAASSLNTGVLTAVFIYWGWDTAVAVNEETERAEHTPGHAALVSTVLLLGIYVVVAVAAEAVHGPQFLVDNKDDVLSALGRQVLPYGLDKLLIVAVLTSASAATQTTILPATRSMLSMAAHGAAPRSMGAISPRYRTPNVSTLWMGGVSILWCLVLSLVSQHVLDDSVTATGLAISFYLAITGLACTIYFRKALFNDVRTFVIAGLGPSAGFLILGYVFVRSCIDLADPARSGSGDTWLGVGAPLAIAILSLFTGLVLMGWMWRVDATFFQRRSEAAEPTTKL